MKVLILGASGMLGNSVAKVFSESSGFYTAVTARPEFDLSSLKTSYDKAFRFDCTQTCTRLGDLNKFLDERDFTPDYVINCIGVIKPFIDKCPANSVFVNSYFPHYLSQELGPKNIKVIHITTDCVFSGKKGSYNEDSVHDEVDFYGQSKSLGETKNCMVLRTSIIGNEIHKNASLVAWLRSQKFKEVFGYTNHWWNGVTTTEYGNICKRIIENDLYEKDLFHVHSPEIVNKYELLEMLNNKFDIGVSINPAEAPDAIDTSLSTLKKLNEKLGIAPLQEQVNQMS